jgi:tetratricopeptide (TPR) repeat protein
LRGAFLFIASAATWAANSSEQPNGPNGITEAQEAGLTRKLTSRAGFAALAGPLLVALALAAEVSRLSVAAAVAGTNDSLASRLAAGAPPTLISTAMKQVGEAALSGGNPSADTFDRLHRLAAADPLGPTPFLVEGAIAERNGNYDRAAMLLKQARIRDPRSIAARYLLADVWLRQQKVVEGLSEMAVLTRFIPAASVQLAPSLATYAKSPGAREKLAAVLKDNPQLKNPLLSALAADPENADLVIALAGPPQPSVSADTKAWESRLISGLVARGDYERAYALWRRFARLGEGERPLLFNGEFRPSPAPAPFNWDFSVSSAGLAEAENGRLRVLFYARDETLLATQLLILPPGRYVFSAPSSGQIVPGALSWTISCIGGKPLLLDLPVGSVPSKGLVVPPGCPAQRVQLNGHLLDSPDDSDLRIGPVKIERAGA